MLISLQISHKGLVAGMVGGGGGSHLHGLMFSCFGTIFCYGACIKSMSVRGSTWIIKWKNILPT